MTEKHELPNLIDWSGVMAEPRYAGGHDAVMHSIFGANAVVIAAYIEDDYSGNEAFAYRFPDGSVAIIADSFGSCSGCDAWEDTTDAEAHNMIESLVDSARLFPDLDAAIEYCEHEAPTDAAEWLFRCAVELVDDLRACQLASKQMGEGGQP